ncbi:unnamed protein product, partial [Didymodactylos carnosus]
NWGVPKQLAIFKWSNNDQEVNIYLPNQTEPFCSLKFRKRFYCIPFINMLIPLSFRTILQRPLDGSYSDENYLRTQLSVRGWFRPIIELLEFRTDGIEIPSHKNLPVFNY